VYFKKSVRWLGFPLHLLTWGQVCGRQVEQRGPAAAGGGVTLGGCAGNSRSGRNVIARDLLSVIPELPLDCESDYRGV